MLGAEGLGNAHAQSGEFLVGISHTFSPSNITQLPRNTIEPRADASRSLRDGRAPPSQVETGCWVGVFFFRFLGAAQVQEDKDLIYTYMQ
jgi:hypothetical protein